MSHRAPRIDHGEWRRQKRRLHDELAKYGWTRGGHTYVPDALAELMKRLVPGWGARQPPYTEAVVSFIITEVLEAADNAAKAAAVIRWAESPETPRYSPTVWGGFGKPPEVTFSYQFTERLAYLGQHITEAIAQVAAARLEHLEREACGSSTPTGYNTYSVDDPVLPSLSAEPLPIEPQNYAAYPSTVHNKRGRARIYPRLERKKGKRL